MGILHLLLVWGCLGLPLRVAPDFVIAGFLPDYRFYIDLNETAVSLTDVHLFSLEPRPELGAGMLSHCCLDSSHFERARQAVVYKEQTSVGETPLKVWLTLGGGGRSGGFAALKDSKKQQQFLTALLRLAEEESLYGVDFDCEEFVSQADFQNYILLILQACQVLHESNIHVSIAVHPGQLLPPQVYKAVDRVQLMAYDMPGKHHASHPAVEKAVGRLIDSGCPPRKIVLGIPAYARHEDNPGNVKTFAEIVDDVGDLTDDFHSRAEWQGFWYDSPGAVAGKVVYAKQMGLGGVFFWELGQDKQDATAKGGILLEAAARQATHTKIVGAKKNYEEL